MKFLFEKIMLILFLIVFQVGCASNTSTLFKTTEEDPISFAERMSLDLSKKMSYPDILISKKKEISAGFQNLYLEFIPFMVGKEGVVKSLENYCTGFEGVFKNNICVKKEKILFFAILKYTERVTRDGAEISLNIVKPLGDNNEDFLNKIKNLGYMTIEEIEANSKNRLKIEQSKNNLIIDNLLINAKAILAAPIGTKICKEDGGIVFEGFKEDAIDQKVKINQFNAYMKMSPMFSPGGFKRLTIWDDPVNWHFC